MGAPTFALACVLALAAAEDGDSPELARGNRLYGAGDLPAARAAYEACLQRDGSDPYCLSNLASIALDLATPADGDEPRRLAERLYRRVVGEHGRAPGTVGADAAFNLALLLQGDKRRASTEEACAIYSELVAADDARGAPSRWDAVANLASCTHDLKGTPLRAFALHTRAIVQGEASGAEAEPRGAAALGLLYRGLGTLLAEAAADGGLCSAMLAFDASELGEHALLRDADQPELAACGANAVNCLTRAVELARESGEEPDAQAEHALAALRAGLGGGEADGSSAPSRASPAFVRALFDDFAPTFDEQLRGLGYAVPTLVEAAVRQLVEAERGGAGFGAALDAGCGTGLLGPVLRPLVRGPLLGVDLSPQMVARARALGSYDGLAVADLLALGTAEAPLPWPASAVAQRESVELIVAGDVFVYFGDVLELVRTLGRLLSAGGRLVFTCEALEAAELAADARALAGRAGWSLTPSGRYAHARRYIEAVASAAGLELRSHGRIVPRVDKGREVGGHLFVLGKP